MFYFWFGKILKCDWLKTSIKMPHTRTLLITIIPGNKRHTVFYAVVFKEKKNSIK